MSDARALQAEVERLRDTLDIVRDQKHFFSKEVDRLRSRLAEAEKLHKDFSQQHAECVYVAEKRAEVAEAKLAEVEKERDTSYDSCIKITQREVDAILRAGAAESKLAAFEDDREILAERGEALHERLEKAEARVSVLTDALEELTARAQYAYDETGNANRYMVAMGRAIYDARSALAGGEGDEKS